jgi:hypothetical protein
VPEFCTCGARLPEDARFCHKCGKPQREEPVLEQEAEPVVPIIVIETPVAPAPPPPINLHNRLAVRAALLGGTAAFFVSAPLGAFGLIGMVLGGMLAVWVYKRGSGQGLSMANGARLGWITGIFLFVLALVSLTMTVALEPGYLDQLRDEIAKRSALPETEVRQVTQLLFSPIGIGLMVLGMFLTSTLPPALGGAVGAKLLDRR